MFFQLLFIHLFRPFLKYNQASSPLPAHVSPRKLCTHAAAMISKLLRIYKRTYGLRQICNIAVYIGHSACTIHLLNLPEKNARRDIIHGLKQLEEIAEGWLCARRTLGILSTLARRWKIDLPEEAVVVLARTDAKFGSAKDQETPNSAIPSPQPTRTFSSLPSINTPNSESLAPTAASMITSSIANTASTPEIRSMTGTNIVPPPPRSVAKIEKYPRQQLPVVAPATQEIWNQEQAFSVPAAQAQSSPSALFGGSELIGEESQDWWLRDQSALAVGFENWNGLETEPAFVGNGLSGVANGTMLGDGMDGMNGTGYMGYGANYFGYNRGDSY